MFCLDCSEGVRDHVKVKSYRTVVRAYSRLLEFFRGKKKK